MGFPHRSAIIAFTFKSPLWLTALGRGGKEARLDVEMPLRSQLLWSRKGKMEHGLETWQGR